MITRGPSWRNCKAQTLFKKESLGKPKDNQDTTTQGHWGETVASDAGSCVRRETQPDSKPGPRRPHTEGPCTLVPFIQRVVSRFQLQDMLKCEKHRLKKQSRHQSQPQT